MNTPVTDPAIPEPRHTGRYKRRDLEFAEGGSVMGDLWTNRCADRR